MINGFFKKYKNMPIELKAGFWFTVCLLIQKGLLFITSPIFTRIMSQTQFGKYSVYISWLNILSMVFTLNLQAGVFNNAMHKYEDDRSGYISSMHGLSLAVIVFFAIVYIAFIKFWRNLFAIEDNIIFMIFVYSLFLPGYNFWICRHRFEYSYVGLIIATSIISTLSLVFGAVAAILYTEKHLAAFYAYVIINSAAGLGLTVYNIAKGKRLFNLKYWKYALKFNIPLMPHYLSLLILGQSDRIMIGRFCSMADAGKYSLVYNFSTAIHVFISSVNQAMTPWQYKMLDKGEFKKIGDVWVVILIGLAVPMLIIIGFAPEIIYVLAGKSYLDAVAVVPPVVLGVYFTALYNMYSLYEFYYESNITVMIASVVGSIINIILNLIFIPMFGYIAAAYTTLFCYVLFSVAHYIFAVIVIKKNLKLKKNPLKIGKVLIVSVCVSIIGFVLNFSYAYTGLRYCVIAAIAIITFIIKDKIIDVVKSVRG